METREYFEKVMQDFNQNRKGRNLRKYCNDEGIDYKWLSEYKRTYGATKPAATAQSSSTDFGFTAIEVIEDKLSPVTPRNENGWTVKQIIICSPEGEELELRSDNLLVVSKLLSKMNS
ncbi:MAG: hypothetical protein ACI4UJ_01480 [Candidatus Cryptobacteroides sp.]